MNIKFWVTKINFRGVGGEQNNAFLFQFIFKVAPNGKEP